MAVQYSGWVPLRTSPRLGAGRGGRAWRPGSVRRDPHGDLGRGELDDAGQSAELARGCDVGRSGGGGGGRGFCSWG